MIVLAAIITSCASPKEIMYLQDLDEVQLQEITTRYEARIKKDDMLSIVVTGPDKQVIMPYNLTLFETSYGNSESITLPYLVDSEGNIDFPILGTLHVEGMTRGQLASLLTEEISKDVKDPVVYVAFKNYKITVLGEVNAPGTYTMNSEKINIFQALSHAGDLRITAKRDDIVLLREVDGRYTYSYIDLKTADLLNEDYFFMQQNDILIVPPTRRSISASTNSTWVWSFAFGSIGTVLGIIGIVWPYITALL